jgi:hypothetical protein
MDSRLKRESRRWAYGSQTYGEEEARAQGRGAIAIKSAAAREGGRVRTCKHIDCLPIAAASGPNTPETH